MGWTVWSSNSGRDKKLFLLHNVQNGPRPTRPPLSGNQRSFPGIQRPGREVNHSPSPSAEVKNEWSYTSTTPICFHGVNTKNVAFTCTLRYVDKIKRS